jgi:hypothetical protein
MPLNKQFAKFSLTPLSALIVPALLAQKPSEHAAQPPTSAQQHFPTYEDVTEQCKIRFQHSFGEQKLSSILEATGSGCVWFDYNNDGLLDLYVLSGRYLEGVTDHSHPDGADATNHLYRNNGDGTFTDVTTQAGVAGKGFAMGVTVGDYDNDGYEDIYVTNWNSVILYHNNGDGTFTDVTEKAGVQNSHWGVGAAFLDYDRDGRLDLFVGNYLKFDPHAKKPYYGAEAFAGPLDFEGDANRLFHNNGDGTFTDVSAQAGVDNAAGRAKGVTVADFDNDGWPDIYVANDQMESYLYRNNHDGTFTNVAIDQNVAYGTNGDTPSAMGPIFADYDNDGTLDLFVSDMRYHRLFRNSNKDGFFARSYRQDTLALLSRKSAQYSASDTPPIYGESRRVSQNHQQVEHEFVVFSGGRINIAGDDLPYLATSEIYLAVRIAASALRHSGPNRARLRDFLASGSPLLRVSDGTVQISFDPAGNSLADFILVPRGKLAAASDSEDSVTQTNLPLSTLN